MDTFNILNDYILYAKTKTKGDALKLKEQAAESARSGKSVVIFFNGRQHLYLAPGQDPYQARKDIENFLNPPPSAKPKKETVTKNTPTRDSSGKFVSKKQSILEPDSLTKTEPSKKKGIFGF